MRINQEIYETLEYIEALQKEIRKQKQKLAKLNEAGRFALKLERIK